MDVGERNLLHIVGLFLSKLFHDLKTNQLLTLYLVIIQKNLVHNSNIKVGFFQKKIGIIYRAKQICRFTILNSWFEFSRFFATDISGVSLKISCKTKTNKMWFQKFKFKIVIWHICLAIWKNRHTFWKKATFSKNALHLNSKTFIMQMNFDSSHLCCTWHAAAMDPIMELYRKVVQNMEFQAEKPVFVFYKNIVQVVLCLHCSLTARIIIWYSQY